MRADTRPLVALVLALGGAFGVTACSGGSGGSSLSDAEFCERSGEFLEDGWNVGNPDAKVEEGTASDDGRVGTSVLCAFTGDDDFGGTLLVSKSSQPLTIAGASERVSVGADVVAVEDRESYQPQFVVRIDDWNGKMTLSATEPSRTQPRADPPTDAQVRAAAQALVDAVHAVAG